MTTSRFDIARCQEEDIPALLSLFANIYPHNPRLQEREYLDWQFRQSPFAEEPGYGLWLYRDAQTIKSFIGCVPVQVRCGDNFYRGCYLQNWYACVRDGSALALLSQVMAHYDYRMMFGITPEAGRIYGALKIPLLSVMPRWIGILDPERVATLCRIDGRVHGARLTASAEQLLGHGYGTPIGRVARFDDEQEFVLAGTDGIKSHVRRTGRLLNWRYIDIPAHDYRILHGPSGQFVVYRIEPITGHEASVVRILEWCARGDWEKSALVALIKDGLEHRAILADFFCTATHLGVRLEALGFVSAEHFSGTPLPHLFRPLHWSHVPALAIDFPPHGRPRHLNFGQWYLTKGDSDLDRIKL